MTMTTHERMSDLAIRVYDLSPALAEELLDLAREVEETMVSADAEGDVPTNAQGIALARFLRGRFASEEFPVAQVSRGRLDLPSGYILVRMHDGYEGGIDRDGRTST